MTAGGTDAALLARIEAYFDAAPRAAADVEEHGALTLFVSRIPWPYYGRPRLGMLDDIGADDVGGVRARQRELIAIGTLPSARRRGIGVALTGALVADAVGRGVELLFLSAADDRVARLYERVGFHRVGTACAAAPEG